MTEEAQAAAIAACSEKYTKDEEIKACIAGIAVGARREALMVKKEESVPKEPRADGKCACDETTTIHHEEEEGFVAVAGAEVSQKKKSGTPEKSDKSEKDSVDKPKDGEFGSEFNKTDPDRAGMYKACDELADSLNDVDHAKEVGAQYVKKLTDLADEAERLEKKYELSMEKVDALQELQGIKQSSECE